MQLQVEQINIKSGRIPSLGVEFEQSTRKKNDKTPFSAPHQVDNVFATQQCMVILVVTSLVEHDLKVRSVGSVRFLRCHITGNIGSL